MPYRTVRFARVGSTNDIALMAAGAGVAPGLVVTADEQVRGKGRKARDWRSPPGGLWATVLLHPDIPRLQAGYIPLAVGCACAEALQRAGAPVRVRWPNDLMLEDRKLGGILVESRTNGASFSVVAAGMGINVQNHPPVATGTSLAEHGLALDPRSLLEAILDRLARYEAFLRAGDAQRLGELFMRHAWGMDRSMLLDGRPCTPKEIAVDGALIVEGPDGGIEVVRTGSLRLDDDES